MKTRNIEYKKKERQTVSVQFKILKTDIDILTVCMMYACMHAYMHLVIALVGLMWSFNEFHSLCLPSVRLWQEKAFKAELLSLRGQEGHI